MIENLPGINVSLKDGGLIIPEVGGSESMLIIAPSLIANAPDEPVLVRSSTELVQYGFGDFYVGGEVNPIAAEWKAATEGGCKLVYLVALKQIDLARAAELEANAIAELIATGLAKAAAEAKIKGALTGADDKAAKRRTFIYFYDLLMGTLLDFSVDHVVLKGAVLEDEVDNLDMNFFTEVNNIEDYPYISGMISSAYVLSSTAGIEYPLVTTTTDVLALKVAGTVQTIKLEAKEYNGIAKTAKDLAADLKKAIAGHASGIKADVREEEGKIVLYFAEAVEVDAATTVTGLKLAGKAIIKKTTNGMIHKGSFAKTVADYCATKTLMKQATVGYIGVHPPVDTKVSTVRKYVDQLVKLDTDISPYLQIVASEVGVVMPGTNALTFVNGATHYAALVSTLSPQSATTNKPVKNVKVVRYDFSLRQLSKLSSKKFVTFRVKDGQLVVTDGITSAPSINIAGTVRESDYALLSTLRITQLAIQVVRRAVEPFIGETNAMPQYNALNTAVKSALEGIRESGAIQGYKFNIMNVSARLDQATILLSIVPAYELRRVDVEVNLSPSEAVLNTL